MAVNVVDFKVSTDVMYAQAEQVSTLGNDMKQHLASMEEIIARTSYYWIGEAGELHRKLYNDQKEDISIMMRRFMEHATDLRTIAGGYETGEKENTSRAQALASDIIE